MAVKVAINGFGRIGRLAFRQEQKDLRSWQSTTLHHRKCWLTY